MKKNYVVLLVFLFWFKILSSGAVSSEDNNQNSQNTPINTGCESDTKKQSAACTGSTQSSILFSCQHNGNFADKSDSRAYWYCNVDDEGGFIAVRRKCPSEQYFCPQFQDCVYRNDVRCHSNDENYQNTDNSDDDDTVDDDNKVSVAPSSNKYEGLDFYAPFEDMSRVGSEKRKTPAIYENIIPTNCQNNTTEAKSKLLGLPGCLTNTRHPIISTRNDDQIESEAESGLKNINFVRVDKPTNEERESDPFKSVSPKRDDNVITVGELTNELEEKLGFREEPKKNQVYRVPDTKTFLCNKEGFFPDPHSCTSFYLCHNRRNSREVEAIKILCPKDTAYDRTLEKCTRQALALCFESKPAIVGPRSDIYRIKKSPRHHKKLSLFTCRDEGRYPDPFNCKNYHYCYKRGKKGFGSLKFSCPNKMLFDFRNGRCGPANTVEC